MNETLKKHTDNIQAFANKHKLVFESEGTVGFCMECVGLCHGDNYVDYNPHDDTTYDNIPEFYSDKLHDITPPDAYHKHNCLAVLGSGEDTVRQLSEWCDSLDKLGVTIETYNKNPSNQIQAFMTGYTGKAIKIS